MVISMITEQDNHKFIHDIQTGKQTVESITRFINKARGQDSIIDFRK